MRRKQRNKSLFYESSSKFELFHIHADPIPQNIKNDLLNQKKEVSGNSMLMNDFKKAKKKKDSLYRHIIE